MPLIDAFGLRLAYEIHDSFGAGPPVLLVSGFGGTKEGWLPAFVPALVAAGHRVVTVDNRGIGGSDAPPPPYSFADMARDTAGLIEGLGIAPCHYVGWSMGGGFGEELAATRPELIASATLMGCARPISTYGRLSAEAGAEMAASGAALPPAMGEVLMMAWTLTAAQRQDDALVQALHDRLAALPPWTGPGRHGQLTALVGGVLDETYREWWPRITQPVLVVSFSDDDRFPPGNGEVMAAAIPDARHVVIEGAAHGGPMTHGPQIVEQVLAFLATVRKPVSTRST